MKKVISILIVIFLLTACDFSLPTANSSSNSNNSSVVSSSAYVPVNVQAKNLCIINDYLCFDGSYAASSYEIYIDDVLVTTYASTLYHFSIDDELEHKVKVKPILKNPLDNCVVSEEITYQKKIIEYSEEETSVLNDLTIPTDITTKYWLYDLTIDNCTYVIDGNNQYLTIPSNVEKVEFSMDAYMQIKNYGINIANRDRDLTLVMENLCLIGGTEMTDVIKYSETQTQNLFIECRGLKNMVWSTYVAKNGANGAMGSAAGLGSGEDGEDGENGGNAISAPNVFITGEASLFLRGTNGANGGNGGKGGIYYEPITQKYTITPGNGGDGGKGGTGINAKRIYLADKANVLNRYGLGGKGGDVGIPTNNLKNPSRDGFDGQDGYYPSNTYAFFTKIYYDSTSIGTISTSSFIPIVSGISLEGTTLSWEPVSGADNYMIAIDSTQFSGIGNLLSYNLNLDRSVAHTIRVQASGPSEQYTAFSYMATEVIIPAEEG